MKINILVCLFFLFSLQVNAQEKEKTFNYFIGVQAKYNNDITGKTNVSQFDNYTNYTNKGGSSYGVNLQNGIYIKNWVAILNLGLHQKIMNQTHGFFDGWGPVAFGEVNFKIPYFSSDLSIGRKFKISDANAIQLTVGYGIEKNLKTDFSGDFNNPNDAKIYYQYSSFVRDKVNSYLNAKVGFIMPLGKNELLFGVSLNSIIEEKLTMRIESVPNVSTIASTSVGYQRKALGIFLTYRFL